jgi:membrane-associated phospholipid phosphatase
MTSGPADNNPARGFMVPFPPTGPSLTVLIAGLLITVAGFVWVTIDAISPVGAIGRVDEWVASSGLYFGRDHALYSLFAGFALLGQRVVVTPVMLFVAVRAGRKHHQMFIPLLAVGFWFLFNAATAVVKHTTGRPSVYKGDAYTWFGNGTLFPSGHITGAVVMWGVIAYLLALETSTRGKRRTVTGWVVVNFVVFVGTWGMGYHWVSDMIAGVFLGLSLLAAYLIIMQIATRHNPRTEPAV